MKFTQKQIFAISFLAFVLSGFAGLIYQSIWTRYLSLVLGHAAFAQTLVLALFMGGMAFGAWWAARLSVHHGFRVLRTYAVIEVLVGIAALAFHFIFVSGTEFVHTVVLPNAESEFIVSAVKWLWAALLILPQCILLGMTFPLLSAGLIRLSEKVTGEILGTLYFTNSIGAAVGALVATFILVPAVGLPGAIMTAGAINLLAGVIVFLASIDEKPTPKTKPTEVGLYVANENFSRLILICAFFTGLSSFVYEVAWVRMLALALGSTVHAFEIMISAFVAGLAFGSFFIRKRIDRHANPLVIAGWAQILMGLAAATTIFSYKLSFYGVEQLLAALTPTEGGYTLFNFASAAIAMLLMFPTAFFAGMTLPVFTAALLRAGAAEQAIGKVYASNTIGAICGVFIAVHVLLPFVGMKSTILIAALIDIALGILIFHRLNVLQNGAHAALSGIAIIAMVATALSPKLDETILASGVFRRGKVAKQVAPNIVYYRDGKSATISTFLTGSGLSIATNGKIDATVEMDPKKMPSPDEETMAMAALLPMVYLPEAKSGAIIGFGSGVTTHTTLGNPQLTSLDTIEIESSIIEGARAFGTQTKRAYDDPRSKIVFADAKTYFTGNRKRYDFIISEPSNPWVSGVASLFSEEFYRFLPDHLNENGVFVQWIQLYEIDFTLVASILKALGAHFADYDMYIANGSDLIIVAKPKGNLAAKSGDLLSSPGLVNELKRQGLSTLSDINLRFVAQKRFIAPLIDASTITPNSDYYPIVSHIAPKNRFTRASARDLVELPFTRIPYAEMLAPDKSLPFDLENSNGMVSTPKVLDLKSALAAAAAIAEPSKISAITDDDIRHSLGVIALGRGNCDALIQDQIALSALLKIGSLIATALPTEQAAAALKTNFFECPRHKLATHFNLTQDFLLALAKRNSIDIITHGQQILENAILQKNAALAELALCASAVALIQQGQLASAAKLLETYHEIPLSQNTRSLRLLLAALVDAKHKKLVPR